jgi:transposase
MPVRNINRQQTWLLPPTLDELIASDHPARFVAMIVDSLDDKTWQKMNIVLEGDPLGAPSYHPRAMLGVWLYGFMTGTRSSRKLEVACRDQIPYLWLTGWQHPDHNSLWRFYKAHRDQMRDLFKLTVKTAVKLNLIDMAVQAVDGTKIAANADKERTYDKKGLEKLLARTENTIHELEKENEEGNDPVPVHLPEKLRKAEQLRAEIKSAMDRLATEELKHINLTDGDAKLMKGRKGMVAGYNVQAVVSPIKVGEGQGMLITAVDAVQEAADSDQLVPMLEQAEQITGNKADMTLADAGYHSGSNLAECEKREQAITMPEVQDRALRKEYHKDKFKYNPDVDTFTCPHGQILRFAGIKPGRRKTTWRAYRCSDRVCVRCPAFGKCTTCSHHGRELQIGPHEAILRQHREWMSTDKAKIIYARRKELPEPVFAILKEQMGFRRFLLRGWNNARAEATMMATAFNLRFLCRIWQWLSVNNRENREFLSGNPCFVTDSCIIIGARSRCNIKC